MRCRSGVNHSCDGWLRRSRKLPQLEFCSRAVYFYFGVPAVVYQALLDGPSEGGHFNGAIRGPYAYRQIRCQSRCAECGNSGLVRSLGDTNGAHPSGVTGWQPITDYISLGVIAKFFPVEKIHEVLAQTNRASVRERDLPAHVVVYYVIELALYGSSHRRGISGDMV